ncbi:MAG: hypothetical protein H6698_04590 [Myxococcales bacterium]|nr:hypothetical protein [Myxococcales bacterium]MCB9531348.1 hypothetical protein [Myxococcales bacterium]MCB9533579.1 hypothetical protein [Myxococcales bacterium]
MRNVGVPALGLGLLLAACAQDASTPSVATPGGELGASVPAATEQTMTLAEVSGPEGFVLRVRAPQSSVDAYPGFFGALRAARLDDLADLDATLASFEVGPSGVRFPEGVELEISWDEDRPFDADSLALLIDVGDGDWSRLPLAAASGNERVLVATTTWSGRVALVGRRNVEALPEATARRDWDIRDLVAADRFDLVVAGDTLAAGDKAASGVRIQVKGDASATVCAAIEGFGNVELPVVSAGTYRAFVPLSVPSTIRWRVFESTDGSCTTESEVHWPTTVWKPSLAGAYSTDQQCATSGGQVWLQTDATTFTTGTASGTEACPAPTGGVPTRLQYRVQSLATPLTGAESVCVTVFSNGTYAVPSTGGKFSTYVMTLVPSDVDLLYFIAPDSSCSTVSRVLMPGDATLMIDLATISSNSCVSRADASGGLAIGVHVQGGGVVTERGGACAAPAPAPTNVQIRTQNLASPIGSGHAVCVDMMPVTDSAWDTDGDGIATFQLPASGAKYARFVSLVLPDEIYFRVFESSSSACSDVVRLLPPGAATNMVAGRVINSCSVAEGATCNYWNIASVDGSASATGAGAGACPADADANGVYDPCDLPACTGDPNTGDDDNDGVCNDIDVCAAGDDNVDLNTNGTPDACEACPDEDADTVCDDVDVCPGFDDRIDENGNGNPAGCDVCDPCPSGVCGFFGPDIVCF